MRRQRSIVRLPVGGAARSKGGGGEPVPRVFPVDMTAVKGILREFDRAAYGEEFRADRLAKIAVLGKGATSTVWKMVDVDTLRVVAVKEMVVCDSKQSAVLRHELGVLHPQMQPLDPVPPPKPTRLSGRRSRGGGAGGAGGGISAPPTQTNAAATAVTDATAALSAAANTSATKSSGGGAGKSSSSSSSKGCGGSGVGCIGSGGRRRRGAGSFGGSAGGRSGTGKVKVKVKVSSSVVSRASRNSGGGGVAAAAAPGTRRPGPCPYMPRYFGSFVSQDDGGRPRVSIVLEYVSGVDLARWIEELGGCSSGGGREEEEMRQARIRSELSSNAPSPSLPPPPPPIPEMWLARVCRDLLGALQYLHRRGRIHRDVKPANLLLGPDGARLADFGSTISTEEKEGDRMHGTMRFMSPERLCAKPYRPSSDLWAAGLTVATAALGENPIPHSANNFEAAEHAEAAFDKVIGHPASAAMSPSLLDFLRVVLVPDPDKRPTVEQMLAHSFVRPASDDGGGESECCVVVDGGGSGGGGGGGGGFLEAVRRGGNVLSIVAGRKRDGGERARTTAAAAAAATAVALATAATASENKENQQGQQQQQQQPCSARSTTSSSCTGSAVDRLSEAWTDGVRETLRRLASEPVDAADVVRRVLAARRSRWGHNKGIGSGLNRLDFSHLAAELDVSNPAELRSIFGSLATSMDEDQISGSWSSPAPSSPAPPASPAPVMLPPLGGSRGGRDRRQQQQAWSGRGTTMVPPLSPPHSPHPRSPLPRRRPPPLVLSPEPTPRPVSAVSASALSALSGAMARSPKSPTAAATAAAAAAGSAADVVVTQPQQSRLESRSLPPPAAATQQQRSVSATWTRGWAGKHRTRRPAPAWASLSAADGSRRSVSGVFSTRGGGGGGSSNGSGGSARAGTARKRSSVVVVVGRGAGMGGNNSRSSERNGGGGGGVGGSGAWWKGWGQRRKLYLPRRVVKAGDVGGRGGGGAGGDGGHNDGTDELVRTTELPSASSAATEQPVQPPFSVTPPLSKFDEEADGNAGNAGAALVPAQEGPSLGAPAEGEELLVVGHGPLKTTAAAAVCDGPAPAWSAESSC